MTWQTGLLVILVILWTVAQYGLAAHALRDLRRRPRVRGDNKVVWALVILGVPIAGALVYTVYGPTSFIRRDRPRPIASPARKQTSPDPTSLQAPTLDQERPNRHPAPTPAPRASAPLPELADSDGSDPTDLRLSAVKPAPSPRPRRAERPGRR